MDLIAFSYFFIILCLMLLLYSLGESLLYMNKKRKTAFIRKGQYYVFPNSSVRKKEKLVRKD